ncbi:MAG: peptide chain release factor 2 [Candidatus Magasanikbacteria bacterium]|jgi:peptide chain release factor 2|nr:peptide chain release factor 2 [Candidatus Magasanikbacteria bacterium]
MDSVSLISQLDALQQKIDSLGPILQLDTKKQTIALLSEKVADPAFWSDPTEATRVSKELADLQSEVTLFMKVEQQIKDLSDMAVLPDVATSAELESSLFSEYMTLREEVKRLEVQTLLSEKYDASPAIVSFYAGAGGTEAQDWTEMLIRMILRYAEKKNWSVSLIDESRGQEAGIKSATFRIVGRYAYGYLQSEHGTHRLVRISPFDGEKMRHTSFASIEVIPEVEHADLVIPEKELRVDTFMAGGNGGQSVNTTYSAVRIVHIPTGIMAQCQNEKSQIQNRQTALKILYSRLQQKKEAEEEAERLALRGERREAEWGNQIRSYVLHPYKLVKDVRTKYESADPDTVLAGELEGFSEAYLVWKSEQRHHSV